MIVHGYIEIYSKGCRGWIIVMRFKVLLIMHYLIWEILMKVVLDVNARVVRIKKLSIQLL
jgi:hypothetical protein